jgi:bacteriorhodopsin
MTIVKKTAYLSLFIQLITGLIDIWGLTFSVNPRYGIFKELLLIELIVQVIEFIFYLWLTKNIDHIKNITKYRYYDWFITTPSMLLTLMAYLEIQSTNDSISLIEFIKKYFLVILVVFILNWIMLGFGLLGELGYMDQRKSALLGFIPFVMYFWIIYSVFIKDKKNLTNSQKQIYFYFLIVWSIYGIAAFMNYEVKNSMYNILDLFAKNFFGLFLVYILYQQRI